MCRILRTLVLKEILVATFQFFNWQWWKIRTGDCIGILECIEISSRHLDKLLLHRRDQPCPQLVARMDGKQTGWASPGDAQGCNLGSVRTLWGPIGSWKGENGWIRTSEPRRNQCARKHFKSFPKPLLACASKAWNAKEIVRDAVIEQLALILWHLG